LSEETFLKEPYPYTRITIFTGVLKTLTTRLDHVEEVVEEKEGWWLQGVSHLLLDLTWPQASEYLLISMASLDLSQLKVDYQILEEFVPGSASSI